MADRIVRHGLPGQAHQVRGEEFRVKHCRDPAGGIRPGDCFPLSGTYCVHPCYREFGLEAYIGCPIHVVAKFRAR